MPNTLTVPDIADGPLAAGQFEIFAQLTTPPFTPVCVPGSRLVARSATGILDTQGPGSKQLVLRTSSAEQYEIGRNVSDGLLDFYATQNGANGYRFGGVNGTRWRIDYSGHWLPGADNIIDVGNGSLRVRVVYAATGTINTSDERDKIWRSGLTDAERAAARAIVDELGFFQWHDAVAEKGDGARLHFGVRAQAVWAIMAAHGLVDPIGDDGLPGATPYAFLCFDQWAEETEAVTKEVRRNETRRVMVPIEGMENGFTMVEEETEIVEHVDTGERRVTRAAGHRYGLRMDQLALFLIAGAY